MRRAALRALQVLGVVVATWAAADPPPSPTPIEHVRAEGESLAEIAARYYGDPNLAELLERHNERRLRTGEPLLVPTAHEHTVAAGESWSDLAGRYWGRADLGMELARSIDLDPEVAPVPRSRLEIPALFEWRIRRGETLAHVSRRMYRHPNRTRLLARISGIDTPDRLRVGAQILAPVARSAALPELQPKPAPSSSSSVAPRADPVPEAPPQASHAEPARESAPPSTLGERDRERLRASVNAFLDARFDEALEGLEQVRAAVLARGSDAERVQLLEYLIQTYVAFDRTLDACGPYEALRRIDPDLRLDPDRISPKVLGALDLCDGS